jgi:hypothetical protein
MTAGVSTRQGCNKLTTLKIEIDNTYARVIGQVITIIGDKATFGPILEQARQEARQERSRRLHRAQMQTGAPTVLRIW